MNDHETAKGLAKVMKDSMMECLEDVIEQKCYLVILHMLKTIKNKR